MKQHEIKLNEQFADAVLYREKTFEVRLNDRDYQERDRVKFVVVDNLGVPVKHPLNDHVYLITYVLNGWGLKENYVAFSIMDLGLELK